MSVLELERAAMAPRRWIELCSAFQKQNFKYDSEILRPRTNRIIGIVSNSLLIVPGGRYLVSAGSGISIWDLGYDSTADCKLVASKEYEHCDSFDTCTAQATSDGKGLVILCTTFR